MEQFYKTVDMEYGSWHDSTFKYQVGKLRRPRRTGDGRVINPDVCSPGVLHASRTAPDAARYAKDYPFRLLIVEGIPVVEEDDKAGFRQLRIVEEAGSLVPCFGPNGVAVVDVLDTVRAATADELSRLAAAWAAAWAAAGAAAWDAARDAAWAAEITAQRRELTRRINLLAPRRSP